MSTSFAGGMFLGSLGLTIVSSVVLASSVEKIGSRLNLAESLQGIVTALAADSPEIASAITALSTGRHDIGVGVVFGSSIFNLAALLGLSAVIAGRIRIGTRGLLFNGVPSFAVVVIGAAVASRLLGPMPAIVIIGAVFVPYIVASSLHPPRGHRHEGGDQGQPLVHRHPPQVHEEDGELHGRAIPVVELSVSARTQLALRNVVSDSAVAARRDREAPKATWDEMLSVVPALTAVVIGSIGMVSSAERLGTRFGISPVIVGALVIAGLTGIPNVLASIRLAVRGRGSAVVSESLNSNTLNIIAGLVIPALVVGVIARSGPTYLEAWWLVGMTACVIALGARRGGMRRPQGALVIGMYLAFVALLIAFA